MITYENVADICEVCHDVVISLLSVRQVGVLSKALLVLAKQSKYPASSFSALDVQIFLGPLPASVTGSLVAPVNLLL
jgi:hypothetical protein